MGKYLLKRKWDQIMNKKVKEMIKEKERTNLSFFVCCFEHYKNPLILQKQLSPLKTLPKVNKTMKRVKNIQPKDLTDL